VVARKLLKVLFEGAALAALQIETPLRLAFRVREGVGGWKTLRVVFSGGGGGGVREVAATGGGNRRAGLRTGKKKKKNCTKQKQKTVVNP
jgi:hypothetical protein